MNESTQTAGKTGVKSAAKPVAKSAAKPSVKSSAKPAVKSVAKPVAKPSAKSPAKPATEAVLQERLFQILLRPLISEKTTAAAEQHRQVAFQVLPNADKDEIKRAVEALFDVKVMSVQVANMRGKVKRGRTPGKRNNWKKAYVRLHEGHDIDFVGMSGA